MKLLTIGLLFFLLSCSKEIEQKIEPKVDPYFSIKKDLIQGKRVHFPWTQIEMVEEKRTVGNNTYYGVVEVHGLSWDMSYNANTCTVILYMTEWVGAMSFYRYEFINPSVPGVNEVEAYHSYIAYDKEGNQLGVVTNKTKYNLEEDKLWIRYFIENTLLMPVSNI